MPNLPLLDIQQACADRLDADAWFDAIPVISENLGDVATIVEIAVAKLGSCVVIETPVANAENPNIPAVYFSQVPIVATVWENVLINRATGGSLKRALDTAQIVAFLLHQYIPAGLQIITLAKPTIVKADALDLVGYHVMLTTSIGFSYVTTGSLTNETSAQLLTEAGAILTTETT